MELPAILLAGPTASGKSALALALCDRLPGRFEIVTVDSAQVYRGMDIGTAKPDAATRRRVPHHLLDIRDPAAPYSAAQFVADATRAMAGIRARGSVPLLVGGTLLYFRALLRGLSPLPAADPGLRARLTAEAAREGWPALHARLAAIDARAARRVHPNDAQRIQRALEIHALTGKAPTALYARAGTPRLLRNFMAFAYLPADRALLAERIAARFERMLEAGFVEEVRALHARPELGPELPSMRAVGYRQLWRHLDGACTLAEAREQALAATRQYAKRQCTWLRAEPAFVRLPETQALGFVLRRIGKEFYP